MDREKIILFYRDDNLKQPILFENQEGYKIVAAIPCQKRFLGKKKGIKTERIKKWIKEIYDESGAYYFWLEDVLCEYLGMDKMSLPDGVVNEWLDKIPFFHTLIYADNETARAKEYIQTRLKKVATICVVCYEDKRSEYEKLEMDFCEKEGIVLQIFTYQELSQNVAYFQNQVILKGRAAVLDFEDRRSFWDKRLEKGMGYYSVVNENRLFLDTFKKNRYNTVIK